MASSCSLAYRLGAARFRRCPTVSAHTVFAVGGLYGNPSALAAVLERAAAEPGSLVVFNGDFNFFNAEPRWWSEINSIIRAGVHTGAGGGRVRLLATQGNVEAEASDPASAGGCGCDYPSYVSEGIVSRSDQIVGRLRAAGHHPDADPSLLPWLRSLPPALTVNVAADGEPRGARVAILHGDPESLSGWGLSSEAVDAAAAWASGEDANEATAAQGYRDPAGHGESGQREFGARRRDATSQGNSGYGDAGRQQQADGARVADGVNEAAGAQGYTGHGGESQQQFDGEGDQPQFVLQQAALRRQLGFDEALHERTGRARLLEWFGATEARAILSTHSCLAFAQDLVLYICMNI